MNISDIAKLAGVSPSTVSRYLNDGYVSKEKREIIAKVIQETGYAPLAAAQSLKNKKIRNIGVVVPRLSSESIAKMVDGISKRLEGTEYHILLANTENNPEKELDYLQLFELNHVDAVIFSATEIDDRHLNILRNYNKPIVIGAQNVEGLPCVYNDDEGAAYKATKHLIEEGCRRIVYIGVTELDISAGLNRHKGFERALREAGLEAADTRLVDFSTYEGYGTMEQILNTSLDFDGVFCATDNIAAGVINSIAYAGKSVPDDIKVIGIGDSLISKLLTPTLSTVHLYFDEVGREAADMIIDFLDGNATPVRSLMLGSELCVRESTTKLIERAKPDSK